MSHKKKKTVADDLIESLLEDVGSSEESAMISATDEVDDRYSDKDDDANEHYSDKNQKDSSEFDSHEYAQEEDDHLGKLSLPNIELTKTKGPSSSEEDQEKTLRPQASPSQEEKLSDVSESEVNTQRPSFSQQAAVYMDDKTVNIGEVSATLEAQSPAITQSATHEDRTLASPAFAQKKNSSSEEKIVIGSYKSPNKPGLSYTSVDASLAQAENFKMAQSRILELEKEVERLRQENEELATAAQIVRRKSEELTVQVGHLEREKNEVQDSLHEEVNLLRGSLSYKENELISTKAKVEELDARLKNDFKKIRVRERELENRLELARAEKQSLVQAKDEIILNLQRKIDQFKSELDTYKSKVSELNRTVDSYQDQTKRTMRALRLAMTNMEVKDVPEETVSPLKKAE
jgi:hypothetical protein